MYCLCPCQILIYIDLDKILTAQETLKINKTLQFIHDVQIWHFTDLILMIWTYLSSIHNLNTLSCLGYHQCYSEQSCLY